MAEHIPVLLKEVLDYAMQAKCACDGCFTVLDATLGLAGHTKAILQECGVTHLYGFDQDGEARHIAEANLSDFAGKFTIYPCNFSQIATLKAEPDFDGVNFILFDLGVSNLQLTESERGFSFVNDGPLDMRMNQDDRQTKTAEYLVNNLSVADLTEIFRTYGEEKFAYKIAKAIERKRQDGFVFKTTFDLANLIRSTLPQAVQRASGGHPARRVFQALRIVVNSEMSVLKEALTSAFDLLKRRGTLCVISYHSLEDKIVKNIMREKEAAFWGVCKPRKVITPSAEEIENNHKSRSAKMRVFVRFDEFEEEEARKNARVILPY